MSASRGEDRSSLHKQVQQAKASLSPREDFFHEQNEIPTLVTRQLN